MAVQYNKDTGWGGFILDIYKAKKGIVDVSDEATKFFDKTKNWKNSSLVITDEKKFDSFIKKMNLTDESLINFLKDTNYGTKDLASYQQYLKDTGKSTTTFSSFTKSASSVLKSFGAVLGSMGVNWAIGEVIGLAVTAIDKEVNRVEYAQERLEEFNSTVSESKKDLEDQQKWIKENGSRYEELARGVDNYGHNVSLSTDEFSEYQSIVENIADMFPDMISGYNDQNDAIIKTKGNVEALTESYKENTRQAYASTLAKSSETFSDYKTAIEDAEKQSSEINFMLGTNNNRLFVGDNYGFNISDGKFTHDLRSVLGEDIYGQVDEYIRNNIGKFESRNKNGDIEYTFSFDKLSSELQQKIRGVLTTANSTIASETTKVKPVLEALIYGEDGASSGYGQLSEDGKQAIRNIISNLDDTFYSQFDSDTEMAAYFKSYFIEPLKDGLDSSDLAVKINTLFSIDKNDYSSYKEYVDAVLAKINELKNYKDDNGNPIYSDDQIESIKKTLGVSNINSSSQLSGQALINATKDEYKNIEGAGEYIDTLKEDEIRVLYELKPDEGKSLEAMKRAVDKMNQEAKNQTDKTDDSSQKTFNSFWESLGVGDDETSKAQAEAKENLIELAKTGKLTIKEFKDSTIADAFEKAGFSAEEATKKINKMVEEVKQLSSMRTGITAITSAYDEKKDSKNKVVSSSTLDSIGDTLGVSSWSENDQKVWESYKSVAGDGTKSLKELKTAQDELATSYVNSNNFLANLNATNADYYEGLLKEMGVTNAHEIITNKVSKEQKNLAVVKKELGVESDDFKNASVSEIAALYDTEEASKEANQAMYDLMTSKIAAGNVTISTLDDCNNLLRMAEAAGIATNKLRALLNAQIEFDLSDRQSSDADKLQDAINSTSGNGKVTYVNSDSKVRTYSSKTSAISALSHLRNNAKKNKQKALANTEKWIKNHKNDDVQINLTKGNKSNDGSGSKKDKDSSSSNKQEFDWIDRRITRLTAKISLLNAQKENLFTVKKKNANLNKQITNTTKLINTYSKAVTKYTKKANSISLSASLKKQVQNGKITGSYKSLIKQYGEKTANKIQKYQDYYDKAQSAKQSKAEARAQKRALKEEKYQNYVDLYDSRTSRAEAKEALQTNYTDKNKSVETQIKNIRKSYEYQKEIAKLTGNKAELDKLEYELQKKVAELKLQEIQNIQDDYDKQIGIIDNNIQDMDNAMSLAEAKGKIVTAGYYKALNSQQTSKRAKAAEERNTIQSQLAAAIKEGSIKVGSDEWYEVQSTLQELDNTINECDVSIAENNTAIRELHTAMLDAKAEAMNRANTEADFLANLLSRDELTNSDTGTMTKAGLGTLGTYGINLETAQSQLRELNKERAILENMKKTGSLDFGDDGKHKYDSAEQLEEAYNDLIAKQQEWTQTEFDAEQKIIDLMKEYYQAQLDYMKEIIDAKKEALDYEKDLYDYQKNIAEKTKSIATLEKQAAALKGDTSEEGRARLSQIQLSLDEANQDLQDTEYERYISDQQDMLDNMYEEYEDLMQNLFKNTDKLLQDGILAINKNGTLVQSILNQTAADYNYDYSDDFRNIVSAFGTSDTIVTGIKNSITGDESSISKKLDTINTTIETKYKDPSSGSGSSGSGSNSSSSQGSGNNTSGSSSGSTTQQTQTTNGQTTVTPEAMDKMEGTSGELRKLKDALNAIKGAGFEKYWTKKNGTPKSYINKRIAAEPNYDKTFNGKHLYSQILTEAGLKHVAKKLGLKHSSGSEAAKELSAYAKKAGFQTGGIVRANGIPLKGDNVPIRVNPNETVLTQEFTDMLPTAVDMMDKFVNIPLPNYNALTNANLGNQTIGDIVIQAELPNVTNAQDFVSALQNDTRVQKALTIATKDLMNKGRITNNIQSIL